MNNHETKYFQHVMLMAEYGMTLSLHFLPEFHLSYLARWLGIACFAIYSAVSVLHFRHATKEK
jgi:hypothetical protein